MWPTQKERDTVVVSTASGAIGAMVGQIANIKGCRAVGIAGGAAKCRYIVDELGFDATIDYESEDVRKILRTHCPGGVNVYFDNVGGDILDIAPTQLARHAGVVGCGAISKHRSKDRATISRSWKNSGRMIAPRRDQ